MHRSALETQSFHEFERVKASILETYEDDFHKYGSRVNHLRILNVFKKLPLMVAEKFKYANVDRNEQAHGIENDLHLLEMARIAFRVKHSACNGVPLGAETNEKSSNFYFWMWGSWHRPAAWACLTLKLQMI